MRLSLGRLSLLGGALMGVSYSQLDLASADDWQSISPGDAGFAPNVGELLDEAVERGDLPNLHAVVVARRGKLVLEHYYEGPDERWGQPLWTVTFGPDVEHDLRSISKSIVGLLYGIALEEGRVSGLDEPLVDQFPAYEDLRSDPERRRMTVKHALTMTLGSEWDESLPYTDPRNSEIAMERAADRYRFVLGQRIVAEPGSRWVYNGGATAVLGHLIAVGTGISLFEYAREKLFQPLGIAHAEWVRGLNGEPSAASGPRMRPRDLAKIGQLVLNQGSWEGRKIVPRSWLEASFEDRVPAEDELEYGYQWWLGRGRVDGRRWIAGFGNGGQRLIVPDLDLVVAILAGNYNQPDAWKLSATIMGEILLPALRQD
jgi:CubicO group peptidase (beta-lactamase class C family)